MDEALIVHCTGILINLLVIIGDGYSVDCDPDTVVIIVGNSGCNYRSPYG